MQEILFYHNTHLMSVDVRKEGYLVNGCSQTLKKWGEYLSFLEVHIPNEQMREIPVNANIIIAAPALILWMGLESFPVTFQIFLFFYIILWLFIVAVYIVCENEWAWVQAS